MKYLAKSTIFIVIAIATLGSVVAISMGHIQHVQGLGFKSGIPIFIILIPVGYMLSKLFHWTNTDY